VQIQGRPVSSTASSNLADILSRVLDAGVVIAGDIKIKIVDIELLSIQVRLVIASVDKACEMGLDWWRSSPDFCPRARRRRRRVRAAVAKEANA
jgi:gas vesicle protein GvpA/GvpJ/GvpM family